MNWQPFSTAPKDGTSILTFGDWGMIVLAWLPFRDASYPFLWQEPFGDAVIRPWKDNLEPTHWMPLPEPPRSPTVEATDLKSVECSFESNRGE